MRNKPMIKILFVCHGNICRSPMAEFVMKDMVKKAGYKLAGSPLDKGCDFYIESAATSTEELGNAVYPPARRELASHGIDCSGKTARQMKRKDYDDYDLLIGMDYANTRNMTRIAGADSAGRIHMLMEYAGRQKEVADPWYTRDFGATWRDVNEGCRALLEYIEQQGLLRG